MKFDKFRNDFIAKQSKVDPEYPMKYWKGYEDFKIGVLLKEARTKAGLTQEEVANKLQTTRSAVSRIENHATDVKLSTLEKFADALGKKLTVALN